MTVRLRPSGWELGGAYCPWLWGEINYWDLERPQWRDVLRSYRHAGHAVVSTAVLPRVHQLQPDQYDFASPRPQSDLAAFLGEIQEADLKAVLWLGPRDCPGAGAAGYPEDWLLAEDHLARDSSGGLILSQTGPGQDLFSLPCLLSSGLHQRLLAFFQALAPVLSHRFHPDGPIIGIGLTQAPGWLPGLDAFAGDYHSEALEAYRHFLRRRYSRIELLNQAYSSTYADFKAIEPPRGLEQNNSFPDAGRMDWALFREEYFVQAAERLYATSAEALNLKDVPVFLATLPVAGRPGNLLELERSRCFAYAMPEWPLSDTVPKNEGSAWASVVSTSRFLTIFHAPMESSPDELDPETVFKHLKPLAYGVRGWDALAPCGGGALPGFICNRQGVRCKPQHPIWEKLQDLARTEDFLQSQFHFDILLIKLPEFERSLYLQMPRLKRLDWLGEGLVMTPSPLEQLDPETRSYAELVERLETFLHEHQFAFAIADAESAFQRLQRALLVLVPSAARMSASVQALCIQLLNQGCHVVLVGPRPEMPDKAESPTLEEWIDGKIKRGQSSGSKKGKGGRLIYLPEWSREKLLRGFQQLGISRPLTADHPDIRLTFHQLRNRTFVAAVHSGWEPVETVLSREGKFVLKDFWESGKFWGGNNEIRMAFPPRAVKLWELIVC